MKQSEREEFRKRLDEIAETQGWVHDVINLNTGQVMTFALDRAVTPLSRAQRLSQLGHRVNPSVFGRPHSVLTARVPYQASPQAALMIFDYADFPYEYNAYDDVIIMHVSQTPVQVLNGNMRFLFFLSSGTNLVTVSLPFSAAWPGKVGHIRLWNYTTQTQQARIPITSNVARNIDMLYAPSYPNEVADIRIALEAGVQFITFKSISFGPTVVFPPSGGQVET
jgi:hypothetical protein